MNRKGILNQDFVCTEEVNANLTKYTSLPHSRSSPVNFLTTDLLSITISGDCVQTYSSSRRPRSTRVRRSFTPTRGWRPSGRGWSTASFTQRHLRWIGSASPMYVYTNCRGTCIILWIQLYLLIEHHFSICSLWWKRGFAFFYFCIFLRPYFVRIFMHF